MDEDDIYHWSAKIFGPKDSPYEGGIFYLDIVLPNTADRQYPYSPP